MRCKTTQIVRIAQPGATKILHGGLILAALFLIAISAASCSRYCAKHYHTVIQTIDSSRVVTEIKYRDTTIYIHVPGKTIYDSIPVQVQIPGLPPSIVPNRVHLELEYCSAESWIANNKLFLNLSQKDTIIATKIKNALQSITTSERYWRNEVVRIETENRAAIKEATKKGRSQGSMFALGIVILILLGYYYVKSKL